MKKKKQNKNSPDLTLGMKLNLKAYSHELCRVLDSIENSANLGKFEHKLLLEETMPEYTYQILKGYLENEDLKITEQDDFHEIKITW